ncbi:MAG: LLM class flavin-dependent oxidoreductase [Dehalococcoidia bacterium]|nr:LLM class flavin-dependent oxidoreductase [Dehalococcoidia bacterium]
MRIGLSWDVGDGRSPVDAWKAILDEIEVAAGYGFDSAWMTEERGNPASCSAPASFLTAVAARSRSLQLRMAGRTVNRHHFVRLAEEVAVLDLFSRGRAGVSFAAASRTGVAPGHVHEAIDFVRAAWSTDEFRFRGDYIRFPRHTPDSAPAGASEPDAPGAYVPQWEWGPDMPDFLSITPKPYAVNPPVYVEIDDDETLAWAAARGVSPFVRADVPTETAVERLRRYRSLAARAGVPRSATEPVLERRVVVDGATGPTTLGGTPEALINTIRGLRAQTGMSHLVWRRSTAETGEAKALYRFASQVQPLLQA